MLRSRRHRILCVAPSFHALDELCAILQNRYEVLVITAPDQAVAVCASNLVATVVLASEFLTAHGWTLAQAMKSVRPEIPLILLAEGHRDVHIPHVIDAVLNTPADVLREIDHRLDSELKDSDSNDSGPQS